MPALGDFCPCGHGALGECGSEPEFCVWCPHCGQHFDRDDRYETATPEVPPMPRQRRYFCSNCGPACILEPALTSNDLRCPQCLRYWPQEYLEAHQCFRDYATEEEQPVPRAATLDIDRLLGKTRNRVQYVGLELEGGWTSLPEGVNLVGDGSVQVPELSRESSSTGRRQVGELQSEPMPLLKVEPWLKKFYPQCVNKSCGLHVHMSFRSALHYMWLMRPEYQRTMLDYLLKWATSKNFGENHVIWPRLKGKNAYCADSYWADIQASQTSKSYSHDGASRYTAINYCYGQHETVECRVLPMFDKVEQSIEAVHQVIAITNAVLALSAKKEKRESSSTMADEMGIIIEESTIRV